jgi:hypothetical protein
MMEGEQHNTYDIEFYGPNTMCGSLYLGALRAGAEMARAVGDAAAGEYERLAQEGSRRQDELLWNGEFYVQQVRNPSEDDVQVKHYMGGGAPAVRPGEEMPRYQYAAGCLADQLLGQWFAHVVGLGHLLPAEHVREAVRSIYRHNWRTDFSDHHSCQRTYALNDESGLLLCSWPNGGRPRYPFPYADEVWTGIEYQVAAHLIYEGLVDEGVNVVRGLRARHDGVRRNPWDEFECGHHYARALASWSLLLALSGYRYSAPAQRLGFAPRVNAEDFRCFFSTGSGWGVYGQQRAEREQTCRVTVQRGRLSLRSFEAELPAGLSQCEVAWQQDGASGQAVVAVQDGRVSVDFGNELSVDAGGTLEVTARW